MIEVRNKEDLCKCLRNELAPCNPFVSAKGLAGFLEYRINADRNLNFRHPDCLYEGYDDAFSRYYGESLTSKCFERIYSINPRANRKGEIGKGRSDTIFNCWSFLTILVNAVWKGEGKANAGNVYSLFSDGSLFEAFTNDERDDLAVAFDKLGDYHHSLANFMPAPMCLNYRKGNYKTCNDMPDLFYKLTSDNDDMNWIRSWIDRYKDEYGLQFFTEFNSGLSVGWTNNKGSLVLEDEDGRQSYIALVLSAVKCIENRASYLWKNKLNSHGFRINSFGEISTL